MNRKDLPPRHPNCRCSLIRTEYTAHAGPLLKPVKTRHGWRYEKFAPSTTLVDLLDMPPADRAVLIQVLGTLTRKGSLCPRPRRSNRR